MRSKRCATFVILSTVLAGGPAAAIVVPLGTASGGLAVHYNNNGGGEVPTNVAYVRSQMSAANSNGALFQFSNAGLPAFPGVTFQMAFSGLPAGQTQFGIDIVVRAPSYDGTNPVPPLDAKDNVNGTPGGATNAGPVSWAISDYKGGGSSDGPQDPLNAITNSSLRGGDGTVVLPGGTPGDGVELTKFNVTLSGTVFSLEIGGQLSSDHFIHWYNPATADTNLSNLLMSGRIYFSGTLTYDVATDTNPLLDFYTGTMNFYAEGAVVNIEQDVLLTYDAAGNPNTTSTGSSPTLCHAMVDAKVSKTNAALPAPDYFDYGGNVAFPEVAADFPACQVDVLELAGPMMPVSTDIGDAHWTIGNYQSAGPGRDGAIPTCADQLTSCAEDGHCPNGTACLSWAGICSDPMHYPKRCNGAADCGGTPCNTAVFDPMTDGQIHSILRGSITSLRHARLSDCANGGCVTKSGGTNDVGPLFPSPFASCPPVASPAQPDTLWNRGVLVADGPSPFGAPRVLSAVAQDLCGPNPVSDCSTQCTGPDGVLDDIRLDAPSCTLGLPLTGRFCFRTESVEQGFVTGCRNRYAGTGEVYPELSLGADTDGLPDCDDNCPLVANATQTDSDGDLIGDACDLCNDPDGDGFGDPGSSVSVCQVDICPDVYNPNQSAADGEGDGIPDECDKCPADADNDSDGDGLCTATSYNRPATGGDDNCPGAANVGQTDEDGDGLGDACEDLVLQKAAARIDNSISKSNGQFKLRGEVTDTSGQLGADLVAGTVTVRARDGASFDATATLTGCAPLGSGRYRCLSTDRLVRAVFRPVRGVPYTHRFRVKSKGLADTVTGSTPPVGPLRADLTHSTATRDDIISTCTTGTSPKLSCK